MQLLSECGSTYNCLSSSVPEIHSYVAGTLSNQQTKNPFPSVSRFVISESVSLSVCLSLPVCLCVSDCLSLSLSPSPPSSVSFSVSPPCLCLLSPMTFFVLNKENRDDQLISMTLCTAIFSMI